MAIQKRWIFSNLDLWHLQMAVRTEIDQHNKSNRPVPHHLQNLEDLSHKLSEIQESTERDYANEKDETGTISEQLLITLIEKDINERREDPYTVIPVGSRWAVVLKSNMERPISEKTHAHATHAHRAKRRLNAAARETQTEMNG